MKRDTDLSRALLKYIEEHAPPEGWIRSQIRVDDYDHATIVAHLELLFEAGYVEGRTLSSLNAPPQVMVKKLTNRGHDALQAVSNDKAWESVKKTALEKGVSLTFDAAVELAKRYVRVHLGLPI